MLLACHHIMNIQSVCCTLIWTEYHKQHNQCLTVQYLTQLRTVNAFKGKNCTRPLWYPSSIVRLEQVILSEEKKHSCIKSKSYIQ